VQEKARKDGSRIGRTGVSGKVVFVFRDHNPEMSNMQTVDAALPKIETTSTHSRQLAVADRVVRRLRQDQCLRNRDVTCEFHEGVLILRGCLPTYYLKQLAQTLAAQVDGVQQLDNRIEVPAPPTAVPIASP
jgi:osmotically-inducible protein OsmY